MAKVLLCTMDDARVINVEGFIPTAIREFLGGRTKQHWLGGTYWAINRLDAQLEADPENITIENKEAGKAVYGDAIIFKIHRRMNPKGMTKQDLRNLGFKF
jgi:hypothetical protein